MPTRPLLPDYQWRLAEKGAEIEPLQAKVAGATKFSEATQALNEQIASLK